MLRALKTLLFRSLHHSEAKIDILEIDQKPSKHLQNGKKEVLFIF